jgi:hypothetical protein
MMAFVGVRNAAFGQDFHEPRMSSERLEGTIDRCYSKRPDFPRQAEFLARSVDCCASHGLMARFCRVRLSTRRR